MTPRAPLLLLMTFGLALTMPLRTSLGASPPGARASQPHEADAGTLVVFMVDLSGSVRESPDGGISAAEALNVETRRTLSALADSAGTLPDFCGFDVEVWGFYSQQQAGDDWGQACRGGSVDARFVQPGNHREYDLGSRELPAWKSPQDAMQALQTLKPASTAYDTPLREALAFGRRRLKEAPSPRGQRMLVLVSDGVPDCYLQGEPRDAAPMSYVPDRVTRLKSQWADYLRDWTNGKSQQTHQFALIDPRLRQKLGARDVTYSANDECILSERGASRCSNGRTLASVLTELNQAGCPSQCGCTSSATYEKEELTCDGIDNDCDGMVDEPPCYPICEREASFPDVVAVGHSGRWRCTGVLIHPSLVLTARHCLPADRVMVGDSIEEPQSIVRVLSSEPYPAPAVDVALLTLEREVKVALHERRSAGEQVAPGIVLSHVGFGASNPTGQSGFGAKRELLLDADGWGCTPERSLREGCDPRFEMRLGGSPGRDTCSGDSGGGLFEFIPSKEPCIEASYCGDPATFPRFGLDRRLVGITSRSLEGATTRCGQGGIYTRVDAIRPWLEMRIREAADKAPPVSTGGTP